MRIFKTFITLMLPVMLLACTQSEVTQLSLSETEKTIILGEAAKLIADADYTGEIAPKIQWTSSDASVVTVDNGEIKGISEGTAIITATAGYKKATCEVTVSPQIKASLSAGVLSYWGDYYKSGLSVNYIMYLTNETDTLEIEVNTNKDSTTVIPLGTYTMKTITDYTKVTDYTPLSLIAGDAVKGFGSWFYTPTIYTRIKSGQMTVARNKGTYKIDYTFLDSFGNSLKGTFEGKILYVDKSQSSAVASVNRLITRGRNSGSHNRFR